LRVSDVRDRALSSNLITAFVHTFLGVTVGIDWVKDSVFYRLFQSLSCFWVFISTLNWHLR
jgi:hypothetical protein